MKPLIQYDKILQVYLQVFVMSSPCYPAVPLAAVKRTAGIRGMYTTSFTDRQSLIYMCQMSGMQEPCNRFCVSNPFAGKQFTKIGTNFCMEIWQCAIFSCSCICGIKHDRDCKLGGLRYALVNIRRIRLSLGHLQDNQVSSY
jgi:hypothetical protein